MASKPKQCLIAEPASEKPCASNPSNCTCTAWPTGWNVDVHPNLQYPGLEIKLKHNRAKVEEHKNDEEAMMNEIARHASAVSNSHIESENSRKTVPLKHTILKDRPGVDKKTLAFIVRFD